MNCKVNDKVITTEAWINQHKMHLSIGENFKKEKFEHPSENWIWLCCPCGAKHLTTGNP